MKLWKAALASNSLLQKTSLAFSLMHTHLILSSRVILPPLTEPLSNLRFHIYPAFCLGDKSSKTGREQAHQLAVTRGCEWSIFRPQKLCQRTREPTKRKQPAAQFIDWAIDPCTKLTDWQRQCTSQVHADARIDWGNTEQRTVCTSPPIISQHVGKPFTLTSTVWVCD